MRLAVIVNGASDYLWIDLHILRCVVGFCWRKADGRSWYQRAWFYGRKVHAQGRD